MVNYVMNPAKKKSKKAKGSRKSTGRKYKRRMSKAARAAVSKIRKAARKRTLRYAKKYAKRGARGRVDSYLKRILCGKRASKRIRREKRRLCGGGAQAAAPATPWFGWGKKGKIHTSGGAVAKSGVSMSDVGSWPEGNIYDNPRRSSFRYRGRNAASLVGSLTSGFNLGTVKTVLPIIGGMAIANFGRRFVGSQSMTPAMLQSGTYGNLAVGVGVAGLAAMLTGRFASKYSSAVLVGGVAEALVGAAQNLFGKSMIGSCGGCQGLGCIGCGALALAGGPADGGVYMQGGYGRGADTTFQAETSGAAGMTAVDADVLDDFGAEDIF